MPNPHTPQSADHSEPPAPALAALIVPARDQRHGEDGAVRPAAEADPVLVNAAACNEGIDPLLDILHGEIVILLDRFGEGEAVSASCRGSSA